MRCDNNLEKLVTITAEDQAHLHNFEQRKKSWIMGVKGKKRKWQKTAFPKFLFFSNNHVPRIITYWFSAKNQKFPVLYHPRNPSMYVRNWRTRICFMLTYLGCIYQVMSSCVCKTDWSSWIESHICHTWPGFVWNCLFVIFLGEIIYL